MSAALRILDAHRVETIAGKADFQLALAKANLMAGHTPEALQQFRRLYLNFPLSQEAAQARAQLVSSGELASLPPEERRHHADALYAATRYSEAGEEYRSLAGDSALDASTRNGLLVAAAASDWKLKRLNKRRYRRLCGRQGDALGALFGAGGSMRMKITSPPWPQAITRRWRAYIRTTTMPLSLRIGWLSSVRSPCQLFHLEAMHSSRSPS